MAKSVLLEVITPSALFYKNEVEMVIVRTLTGEEGFMANHSWACKLLDIGELWILERGADEFRLAAISGGYIDVKQNFVIYTDSAEWAEDIDMARAIQRKEALEGWLCCHDSCNTDTRDIDRAKISITKQLTRMHVAESGARRKR
jgi:F-type H+-transporting ATPase subunit epsilon